MTKYLPQIILLLTLTVNASLRPDSSYHANSCMGNFTNVLIDANKNVTGETSTGTVMDDYSFTAGFDDADRVTSWNRSNSDSQSWNLDLIGNWGNTTGSLAGSTFNENRTHNDVHELTTAGSNSVTYDAKGNTNVDANGIVLVWDIDNHLKSHGLVNFTYDALGRRLEKSELANSTLFICDGQRVIEEYEDSGSGYALERSYVYSSYIDDLIAKIEDNSGSPTPLYYHSDRQFNVRGLTDSTGAIKELYAYSVYGKQTVMDATGVVLTGTVKDNNYGFTGRYLDDETGLWYFRARYFSDELGRFVNRDPLGYVDGFGLYGGYFASGFGLDPSGLLNGSGGKSWKNDYGDFSFKYSNLFIRSIAYSVEIDFVFEPNPKTVCCEEIVWVQFSRDSRDGKNHIREGRDWEKKIVTKAGWMADVHEDSTNYIYNYDNDMKVDKAWGTPGSSPKPLVNATLSDGPSAHSGLWPLKTEFESYVGCLKGKDQNKIYGGYSWGIEMKQVGRSGTSTYYQFSFLKEKKLEDISDHAKDAIIKFVDAKW